MIRSLRQPTGFWRHVFLTLAVLAVALKVATPAGYMAATPGDGAPFALVICTGQGPMALTSDALAGQAGHKAPADKPDRNGLCAFAGHGAGAPAPDLTDVATVSFIAWRPLQARALVDLAPGRGLAAPPLPARGPPAQLT